MGSGEACAPPGDTHPTIVPCLPWICGCEACGCYGGTGARGLGFSTSMPVIPFMVRLPTPRQTVHPVLSAACWRSQWGSLPGPWPFIGVTPRIAVAVAPFDEGGGLRVALVVSSLFALVSTAGEGLQPFLCHPETHTPPPVPASPNQHALACTRWILILPPRTPPPRS